MGQIEEITAKNIDARSLERDEFVARVDYTIGRAQQRMIELQHPEGYWHGALEANAQMNAEFIIFSRFMEASDPALEAKLKDHLLETQQADGSWNLFPGGEGYLSTTIASYFALKLAGRRAGGEAVIAA